MENCPVENEVRAGNGGSQHGIGAVTELAVKAETRRVNLPRNIPLRQNGIRYDFAGNGNVGGRIDRLRGEGGVWGRGEIRFIEMWKTQSEVRLWRVF